MNKYPYPELATRNEIGYRWYETPEGNFYPSITTVLGGTQPPEAVKALAGWRASLGPEKADAFSKKAADRGTNVHLLVERFLKGEKVDAPIHGQPVPNTDLQSFNALKLKLKKIDEVWGQEVTLYSNELEVGGRCDCVGVYNGVPVIIDFKTSGKIKNDSMIGDYKLQLCFYASAHNEMFKTNITEGIILMVAETGFPLEFRIDLEEQRPVLQKRISMFWQKTLNSL